MLRKLLIAVFAGLAAVGIAGALFVHSVNAPVEVAEPVRITIRPGQSTSQIADTLESAALIDSRRVFLWWAKLRRIDRFLQPGTYEFSGPTSVEDILETLRTRQAVTVKVTVPEGWTVKQISFGVADELGFADSAIINLARDPAVLQNREIPIDHMEGYLLPDTYEFYFGATPEEVFERLAEANDALRSDAVSARLKELNLSWHEVLTLASMVEAEAADGNERTRIAAVFHNRLKRRMLMQCDPTVVYAMGGLVPGRSLWTKDLEFESPYNTYLHAGLPPGPICNPGRASIMAALYPDTTRELYFVADGTGKHIFSKSLAEHNRARAQVKRNRGR